MPMDRDRLASTGHTDYRRGHALQSILQDRPRTADIEANETGAAGSVYTSAVHVDFRLVQEELLHASGPVVDWPGIDPDQKGGVRPHWPHTRQGRRGETGHELEIAPQVGGE